MDMTRNSFRNLLCAATVAVLGTFGTGAQATVYSLGWDPGFAGDVLVNIDPSCLATDGLKSCLLSPVSGDFFDSIGREWGIGPGPATSDPVSIVGGQLFALDATFTPFLISDSSGCGELGPGPSLHFSFDGDLRQLTFTCGSLPVSDNTASYTAALVPEPATLALLGMGLGIAGVAGLRRRKPN